MYWADRVAKEIIDSGKYKHSLPDESGKPYWVDDMKTPSGRIHVGSLRGVMIHDFIYKALLHSGQKATFTYLFEDHDPMDELPSYLPREDWEKYLGQPLFTVPSPDEGYKNYGEYFAKEFQQVFNAVGSEPEIIWVSDLYKIGKMNEGIKLCLDRADVIRKIYEETYKKKLPDNWYPFKVVCPNCGKESTTNVTSWDGGKVKFTCLVEGIEWTKGCGTTSEMSPFSGDGKFVGKLPWKVEWAVKWTVVGVTIEGAGKDHMSAGGSHDIAKLICERVLNYPVPYSLSYEFFLLGGRKMSSSKGLGTSAKEISEIMPPNLVRFLFARTDYRQTIDFDPMGTMVIPDLFDEYDRCYSSYIDGSDEDLTRIFEMSQIDKLPDKEKILLPRFRDIVNYIQMPNVDILQKYEEIKYSKLSETELNLIKERIEYAKIWLAEYAPDEFRLQMSKQLPDRVKHLSKEQKEFLTKVKNLVEENNDPESLQLALYNLTKELKVDAKKSFSAIYIALIGKEYGPKAAWFLLSYPKNKVIKRLEEASK